MNKLFIALLATISTVTMAASEVKPYAGPAVIKPAEPIVVTTPVVTPVVAKGAEKHPDVAVTQPAVAKKVKAVPSKSKKETKETKETKATDTAVQPKAGSKGESEVSSKAVTVPVTAK